VTTLAALVVLMLPRVRNARSWQATVTPLAETAIVDMMLEIISLASKAFALYYAVQCAIASVATFREARSPVRGLM
jgi:hypothetical protein